MKQFMVHFELMYGVRSITDKSHLKFFYIMIV